MFVVVFTLTKAVIHRHSAATVNVLVKRDGSTRLFPWASQYLWFIVDNQERWKVAKGRMTEAEFITEVITMARHKYNRPTTSNTVITDCPWEGFYFKRLLTTNQKFTHGGGFISAGWLDWFVSRCRDVVPSLVDRLVPWWTNACAFQVAGETLKKDTKMSGACQDRKGRWQEIQKGLQFIQ